MPLLEDGEKKESPKKPKDSSNVVKEKRIFKGIVNQETSFWNTLEQTTTSINILDL